MDWSRSGFSKDYKVIRVEGNDPERLLNLCLMKGIRVSRVKYISDSEIIIKIRTGDFREFCEFAGGRYRITVIGEDGYFYRLKLFCSRRALLAGLAVFAGILLYQSLFITEIEVNGYKSITEQSLRETMREVGFYEGCRKNINISKVKLHLYEEHDNITWVGIKYKGSLAQVTIAETEKLYQTKQIDEQVPCNIVADKSGYINSIDPEEGIRAAEDGQYVKEGEIIISGIVPIAKTTYEEGSENETETYVHAAGTADARIPVRLNFYRQSYDTVMTATGKKMVTFSVNNNEICGLLCPYETSSVKRFTICGFMQPLKLKIQLNLIEEVRVKKQEITEKQIKNEVVNEIHKYTEEKLPDNAQILNKSLNFVQEKNIIRIGVTLETLQQIGIEEEIIVDKSKRKSEKDDDQ